MSVYLCVSARVWLFVGLRMYVSACVQLNEEEIKALEAFRNGDTDT